MSKSTVQALLKRKKETGRLLPSQAHGGKPSLLFGHEQQIEEMVAQYPDYTLAEYCEYWHEKTGVGLSESAMCRFLKKQQLTLKKNTLRSSQAHKEIHQNQRIEYWEKIRDVEPENLIFLDEMGVLLGRMRPRARSKKGERSYDIKPFYRGSRVTVVGAISNKKVIAMKTMGKSMNGEDFQKFVQEELVPSLWKGAVLVMDNLKAHKVEGVEKMIEAVGAKVVYLSRQLT
ncbi:IS630 family transposase [Microcoleus sp. F10-B4]|uniref:IS630 family transposase n=2 Tax=unclassified Microcoleus TaxID=2642155 RepID=UPI002FD48139